MKKSPRSNAYQYKFCETSKEPHQLIAISDLNYIPNCPISPKINELRYQLADRIKVLAKKHLKPRDYSILLAYYYTDESNISQSDISSDFNRKQCTISRILIQSVQTLTPIVQNDDEIIALLNEINEES